ncbi:MAG: DNA repair protein RecN [Acidobacteria bacterium]|nr:DNA repair protein RecN [Acidobacteriota bacterium]
MLRFLSIKRLAVIDSVEVEFGPGLNVLTGETGAGKSILVEAVGLLLGGRASGDLVRTGEETAAIEAIFENGGEETLVRRELTAQGRSRAFINGALATAGALKELSARLVELHGQHEHQTLLDPATHLAILDGFGSHGPAVAATDAAFGVMQGIGVELERVRRAAADRASRQELVEFQLGELDRAALRPCALEESGEDVELAALRQVLMNAERVERLCAEAYLSLYESDSAVLAGLGGIWRRVADLAALDPQFQPYLDARDGIKSQLEDLALFLRRYADGIEASPARLQQIEDRLALLERLKRKHGPTLASVVAKRDALRAELEELSHADERALKLEGEFAIARDAYVQAADTLSSARKRLAPGLAKALEGVLADLAMTDTRFEVRFAGDRQPESAWGPGGFDAAEFFLSPNPGEDLRPLARIVSGGELSRVMLAIKTLTATSRLGFTGDEARSPSKAAPGLVFDEVDAGIGGRVADVVGRKLHALASAFQVLCITHLPQIAAYADAHFQIEKGVEDGRTRMLVRRLDADGRIEELGRMLGGALVSDGVRASAREMLADRARAKGEGKTKGESESAKAKRGAAGARRTAG